MMTILDNPQYEFPGNYNEGIRNELRPTFAGHVDGTDFWVNQDRLFEVNPDIKYGLYEGWIHSPWPGCVDDDSVEASKWWTDEARQFVEILAALHQ